MDYCDTFETIASLMGYVDVPYWLQKNHKLKTFQFRGKSKTRRKKKKYVRLSRRNTVQNRKKIFITDQNDKK